MVSHMRAALILLSAIVGLHARAEARAEQLPLSLMDPRLAQVESQYSPLNSVHQDNVRADPYYYPEVSDEQPASGSTSNGFARIACDTTNYCDTGCCEECVSCCEYAESCCGQVYGEVQFIFMRAHVLEGGLGPANSKLSEEYEFSPRLVLGAETACGNGVRTRYWHYGHHLNDINNPGGIRFEFDVFDLEAYHRFQGSRTDITVSGGFRTAHASIDYNAGWDDITSLGLTFSAAAETLLCCTDCQYWSIVYGGRFSILGGNWTGSATAVPNARDDYLSVTELNFAVEHGCHVGCTDVFWRLGVELQKWQSDNLAAGTNTDSIGFFGPSVQFGASF